LDEDDEDDERSDDGGVGGMEPGEIRLTEESFAELNGLDGGTLDCGGEKLLERAETEDELERADAADKLDGLLNGDALLKGLDGEPKLDRPELGPDDPENDDENAPRAAQHANDKT
jgi:hypothetical protein